MFIATLFIITPKMKITEMSISCAQSHLTPCSPVDCSLPGSYVHGIFWARILWWVTIPYSRGSS